MVILYGLLFVLTELIVDALKGYYVRTGDINPVTGYFSSAANWMNDIGLPAYFQILTDVTMLAIPVFIWKVVMKNSIGQLGFNRFRMIKKDGIAGLILGTVNCSLVFFLIITVGGGQVISPVPVISGMTVLWFFIFILVGVAEELLTRGFIMAVLRRTRNIYLIMFVPSVIFGLIHLWNPEVTVFSVINIILVGVLFSYMFIKSGNLWMCIGYHISWNIFQGVIYGMPVSGLNIPGIFTTRFRENNMLNGGAFGMEGGVLTTIITLLGLGFAVYYYRNSKYDFISDKETA